VVRRLCGQLVEWPSGVDDQSKARQSARISPGPSNSGSEATLLIAVELEIDVVVSPLRTVPRAPPRRTISAAHEAARPINLPADRRKWETT
jgi:hypothetical protein